MESAMGPGDGPEEVEGARTPGDVAPGLSVSAHRHTGRTMVGSALQRAQPLPDEHARMSDDHQQGWEPAYASTRGVARGEARPVVTSTTPGSPEARA
jgi:hypothetical protein